MARKPKGKVEYFIGRKGPKTFAVVKFVEGESEPAETYISTQLEGPEKWQCDCPAWINGVTRPCKHNRMVEGFIVRGEPSGYKVEA